MRIVIVGAGIIGANLAKELSEEKHEVYVIENREEVARRADEKLDVKVIAGDGADPAILRQAGVEGADLVIAVTTSDETNLIVCSLAAAFAAKKKIARVRRATLNEILEQIGHKHFYIDEIINPELEAARAIIRAIESPRSRDVANFAEGKILLRSFLIEKDSPLCGAKVEDLHNKDFPWPFLIVALTRGEETIIPKGDMIIQEQDRVYVLLPSQSLGEFLSVFNAESRKPQKVVVYGATNIGERVAVGLCERVSDVTLLEENREKAEEVAGRLDGVRVINGSAAEEDILKESGIEAVDCFIAVSASDHSNLISAVLAKKMGAKTTLITTQQPDYMSIIEALNIDSVINPRFLAVDQILRIVRGTEVASVTTLVECNAEAMELIPEEGAPITKAPLRNLKVPKGAIIGAVLKGDAPVLADGGTQIHAGEKVIVFAQEESVSRIQKMFSHKSVLARPFKRHL